MNLLCFVDLHGNLKKLAKLKEKAKDADIIVCAGDISQFENNLVQLLQEFEKLKKYTLIIHGNHESEQSLHEHCKKLQYVRFIHRKVFKFKNLLFFGWGGGGFSFNDKHLEEKNHEFEKILKGQDFIMVTHAPPHNTDLDVLSMSHAGNKTFREFMDRTRPRVLVCGHLHENEKQQQRIGRTLVINPGPEGMLVKI
ncbi:MAG: metallophosphoesterase family protein [Nanoarchaeota archaeon]